jgi:hypothetical protein
MSGMHLIGPYLTTTRYKNKSKKQKSKRQLEADAKHNTWLKKIGLDKISMPKDPKGRRLGICEIPNYKIQSNIAPTSDQIPGHCPRKNENSYTGTEIIGVGQMHKSNAVPVLRSNKEAAKELASMRR